MLGCEMWGMGNVGGGARGVEYGIWGMGQRTRDMGRKVWDEGVGCRYVGCKLWDVSVWDVGVWDVRCGM